MRKIIFILIYLLFIMSIFSIAEEEYKKFEFTLHGGYAFTLVNYSTRYTDTWDIVYILRYRVEEEGVINASSANKPFFGASLAYYFSDYIGVQAHVGYVEADIINNFTYDIAWYAYARNLKGRGTGKLIIMPICINGILRYHDEKISGYITAGYTAYRNRLNVDSYMGYGFWRPLILIPLLNASQIDLNIDESWVGHGLNLGGGFDFKLTENFGLNAEMRYFYCAAKEIDWNWKTGRYPGFIFEDIIPITFDEENAEYAQERIDPLKVNPSFLQISVGIKFFF